ncbi:MAG: L28 family ribosomal protein [bacterium]
MSRRCEKCGRGSKKSASRSHSNIKTIKRQYVNLQYKTVDGERMKVCAKCIKTAKKEK